MGQVKAEFQRTWYHPRVPQVHEFVPAIALNLGSAVHCLPLIYAIINIVLQGLLGLGYNTVCPTERNTKAAADACRSVDDILETTMSEMIECSRGLLVRCVLVAECIYSRGVRSTSAQLFKCEDVPYEAMGIYPAATIIFNCTLSYFIQLYCQSKINT